MSAHNQPYLMTMAAAASKQGIILDHLWTAHLLPRPKEWKETITLKKKTEKGQKRKIALRFFGKTAFHLGTNETANEGSRGGSYNLKLEAKGHVVGVHIPHFMFIPGQGPRGREHGHGG